MTLQDLRGKFDHILTSLNGISTVNFCTAVENAYEAYVLAVSINENARTKGGILSMEPPTGDGFLNQKPGKFRRNRSFKVTFQSGETFFFAADVEVFGLLAKEVNRAVGIKFEADVVVIDQHHVDEILSTYDGYPAPQHLLGVYECKFGSYNKGQLRELLGFRRHVSYLRGWNVTAAAFSPLSAHEHVVVNSNPAIPVIMVRPINHRFFDSGTALLFDLKQIIVN